VVLDEMHGGRKRVGVIAGGPFASVGWPPDLLELAGATFDKGKLVERVDTDDPTTPRKQRHEPRDPRPPTPHRTLGALTLGDARTAPARGRV